MLPKGRKAASVLRALPDFGRDGFPAMSGRLSMEAFHFR